jgi:hypothetical protein
MDGLRCEDAGPMMHVVDHPQDAGAASAKKARSFGILAMRDAHRRVLR